ncbi:DUF1918 domain-containing protein [Nocardia grenadensis]|uniref:DUF1918 domain-containing protein n=1 Tax=Nocardia grenadensis TaxID=931537 RepID=UPI000A05BE39|nr:DUF1918 domain-containing protein [Nocardia grenadensis]
MRATPGDWLIVEGHAVGRTVRRGLIEEIHGADGGPPYLVHWTDTGNRALTFPGPDSRVVTSAELRAQEDVVAHHFSSRHYPAPGS